MVHCRALAGYENGSGMVKWMEDAALSSKCDLAGLEKKPGMEKLVENDTVSSKGAPVELWQGKKISLSSKCRPGRTGKGSWYGEIGRK